MLSIGTDIVEVKRIKYLIEKYGDRFLNRVFSKDEIKYCGNLRFPDIHYAGRFSAKEATIKSLPNKFKNIFLRYKDISISNNEEGKPFVNCKKIDSKSIDISISHTKEHAVSFAVYFDYDKRS